MDELEQLKKVLRALVVSSPSQVDMFSLLRDYRQMMGGHIPAAKFGYREPLSFLKERFNDSFVFHGDPKNPILTPIVTEELKHIDKFVQSQKKNAAVKFKGKRRSIEPPRRVPAPAAKHEPDLIVKTFNKCTINNDHNTTNNTSPLPEKPAEFENHQNERSPEVTTRKSPEIIKVKETHNNKPKEDSSSNAVHSFLKKKTCLYNSQYLDSESSVNGNLYKDDDSGRQTASSNSIRKSLALEELKQEVVELVASSEEGVWCTDLLKLYRERHGRELNYGRFGFTSIISLVSVLDSRLALSRPDDTGDWLLRPRRTPLAPHTPHTPHMPHAPPDAAPHAPPARSYRAARAQKTSSNVDPDDALPGIDFDPDVFPVDCMHFMESIPSLSLGAVEPGALLEVMVGEVYSPSHFWLIRLGEQYHIAMEQIMDEMTEYYNTGEGRDRHLAMGAVRVGHYCSSLFDRDWHRSLIVKVIDSDTVKVRHVDYGTVDRVCVRALKPLLRRWARLPAMALRARLAGLRPGAAGRRWPHAASSCFLDRVRDTKLVASVVAVDREEDILEVFLVNTSTDVDDDVSAALIRSGHADPRRDSCVRVSAPPGRDDDDHDVRSLLTTISQFHNDDTCSEVSASASELVGQQAKRLPTWECPTPEGYLSPDDNFLDTDFRSLLVGSCEENMTPLNSAPMPRKPLVARLQQKCKEVSPPPADAAPNTPSPPQSVLLAKIRALHPVSQKKEGNEINNAKSETTNDESDGATSVASLATQASHRLARIRALHAKIPADKLLPPFNSLSPSISPALTPKNPTSNFAPLTNNTTSHNPLSPSKPPIDLLCPSTPLTASNPLPPATPSLPRSGSSTSGDSADTVTTSMTSLVLRRRLALANKLRKDALP